MVIPWPHTMYIFILSKFLYSIEKSLASYFCEPFNNNNKCTMYLYSDTAGFQSSNGNNNSVCLTLLCLAKISYQWTKHGSGYQMVCPFKSPLNIKWSVPLNDTYLLDIKWYALLHIKWPDPLKDFICWQENSAQHRSLINVRTCKMGVNTWFNHWYMWQNWPIFHCV